MDQPTDRPRISKEPISVILPVYNQAAGLEAIVENWLRALARLNRVVEFVIVDDACTDGTTAIVETLAAKHPEIRAPQHEVRSGFGSCLKTGLTVSTHPLVIYTACDYPYPPADIAKLLDAIDTADLVTGCRTEPVPRWLERFDAAYWLLARVVVGVSTEARPGWLGWRAWWNCLKLRFSFGLRLWDPTSAFKLWRRSVLDRIPIQSAGEFVHAELLAKANFLGCLMAEAPIGRLPGNFKGAPEPAVPGADYAVEARRIFRRPEFVSARAEPAGRAGE